MAVGLWRIVVCPHPDDEGQVLAALAVPASHTVIVTLTQGEATNRRMDPGGRRALFAATAPQLRSRAYDLAVSSSALDRILSWHGFLDAESDWLGIDDSRDLVALARGVDAGPLSTRAVIGLPDGRVDPGVALEALVRLLDGLVSGPRPRYEFVVAGYDHPGSRNATAYSHPDHAAMTVLAASLKQWDPSATVLLRTARGTHTRRLAAADELRMLAPATGNFQRAYGWLAPDRRSWPTGPGDLFGPVVQFVAVGTP